MNLNINAGIFTIELLLDVIPNILRNVSIRDFPAVALVCQKWKEILDDKSFQENLTETKVIISLESLLEKSEKQP